MNPLLLLLGAATVTQLGGGSPAEVNNLKNQMPKEERDAFLKQYKALSGQAKTDFKTALKNADLNAASQIVGQDLTKYNISAAAGKTEVQEPAKINDLQPEIPNFAPQNDFAARIEKILAVPTSIDPALVAEAAKRYESAVPSGSVASITEKTKKLIEVQG